MGKQTPLNTNTTSKMAESVRFADVWRDDQPPQGPNFAIFENFDPQIYILLGGVYRVPYLISEVPKYSIIVKFRAISDFSPSKFPVKIA